MRKLINGAFRRSSVVVSMLLMLECLWSGALSQVPSGLSECAVRIDVVNAPGSRVSKAEKPSRQRDTSIVVDQGGATSLILVLKNEGKAGSFDVSVEPAKAVSLMAGGGTRKVSVKSGESDSLPLTVKGEALTGVCRWESRSLRILVQAQGGTKVCGQKEQRFLCPRKSSFSPGG